MVPIKNKHETNITKIADISRFLHCFKKKKVIVKFRLIMLQIYVINHLTKIESGTKEYSSLEQIASSSFSHPKMI